LNKYGIDIWGDDNFLIEDGLAKVADKAEAAKLKAEAEVSAARAKEIEAKNTPEVEEAPAAESTEAEAKVEETPAKEEPKADESAEADAK